MLFMKLGVLGAGHIAEVVAPTWVAMEGIERYAVSSRNLEKAEGFAYIHFLYWGHL